jgi:hypothetical protein
MLRDVPDTIVIVVVSSCACCKAAASFGVGADVGCFDWSDAADKTKRRREEARYYGFSRQKFNNKDLRARIEGQTTMDSLIMGQIL